MKTFIAIASGLLFGLGLIASGMTDPTKVQGFLDLFGLWDPSLACVMGGAILVGIVGFAMARRRTLSWSGEPIELPQSRVVDLRPSQAAPCSAQVGAWADFAPDPRSPLSAQASRPQFGSLLRCWWAWGCTTGFSANSTRGVDTAPLRVLVLISPALGVPVRTVLRWRALGAARPYACRERPVDIKQDVENDLVEAKS